MATKLWVKDKLFLVDEEVYDEIERLTAAFEKYKSEAHLLNDERDKANERIAKLEGELRDAMEGREFWCRKYAALQEGIDSE